MNSIENSAQVQAINHGAGPCMVLAGPGSGKTFVITRRVKKLIENGAQPERILVITFTRAAAVQMQERFLNMMPIEGRSVCFGTFHSVFLRIISESLGIKPHSIITVKQKYEILYDELKKFKISSNNEHELIDELISDLTKLRSKSRQERETKHTINEEDFENIATNYKEIKKQRGLIDFDDILYICRELLMENAATRAKWAGSFDYILIDEFQDINEAQYEVISCISGYEKNIFIVGDDDQSIYGFRGASPEFMRRFEREYNPRVINLTYNYRSASEIVDFSQMIIKESKNRFIKEALAAGQASGEVHLRRFKDLDAQGEYIAEEIKKYLKTTRLPSIAVLIRTSNEIRYVAKYLKKAGISYTGEEAEASIYESMPGKDVLAYLRLAKGDFAKEDFIRVMNRPERGITRGAALTINNLREFSRLLLYYGDNRRMQHVIRKFENDLSTLARINNPPLLIKYIRNHIGYDRYIEEKFPENAEEFRHILDEIEAAASSHKSLAEFMENVKDDINAGTSKNLQKNYDVNLMTMHMSKGLEFDAVFIPNAVEGVIPFARARCEEEIEEERRVLYVAMTRARKKLYITAPEEILGKKKVPSRFFTCHEDFYNI